MNENFGEINLSSGEVANFMEEASKLSIELGISKSNLGSCWVGSSFDNFSSSEEKEQEKIAELLEHLMKVSQLIELINEHNEKRMRRDSLKQELVGLRDKLYYTEWDEEKQENVTKEDSEVRTKITRKEEEVKELNQRLDQIVVEIDSVTSI